MGSNIWITLQNGSGAYGDNRNIIDEAAAKGIRVLIRDSGTSSAAKCLAPPSECHISTTQNECKLCDSCTGSCTLTGTDVSYSTANKKITAKNDVSAGYSKTVCFVCDFQQGYT